MMLNVGLTGGIASGKSTVAALLVEKGAVHIDFDVLAHRFQEPGGEVWEGIVARFGRGILNEDGTINRVRLGERVFQDQEKLRLLNSIVHPAVFSAWRQSLAEIRACRPDAIVLSDVPLLIEAGMMYMVDVVVLVYIPPAEQIRRLMMRNGYGHQEAAMRLAAQMPIDEKLKHADLVLGNEGDREETIRKVDDLWWELSRREIMTRRCYTP